ncbi:MAG: phosphate propanoyltransferase [Candidatus Staskawiczbacteria bacterium]|nr:phosphate propanoyltransferase [Candidatus Staskawiczbacteria bacterium]
MFTKKKIAVPVEISARHCHLSKADLEELFGQGYELKKLKQLSQPADFACEETLDIKIDSHILENVRIVGPLRNQTQVEISKTDAISIGVNPPVRLSGDLKNSAKIVLVGPAGQVELNEGLIVAKRHIHCATDEAKKLGLKAGDIVSVEIKSERPVIFGNVIVRVRDDYKFCLHLDTDEGNSAGINKIGEGFIIK